MEEEPRTLVPASLTGKSFGKSARKAEAGADGEGGRAGGDGDRGAVDGEERDEGEGLEGDDQVGVGNVTLAPVMVIKNAWEDLAEDLSSEKENILTGD